MTIFEAKEKHDHELLGLPNVVCVGLGMKRQLGQPIGRIAIVVMVEKKVPESQLQPHEIIPKTIEGYETDVVETGGPIVLLESSCCISSA